MERKNISAEKLKELYEEVMHEAELLGIPISRHINGPVINKRVKARFGCCKASRQGSYTVEISEKILSAPEFKIKEIIAHELLHTCKGCMNHGKKWKEYAALLRSAYGYEITRTASYESFGLEKPGITAGCEEYKYVIICRSCGEKIMRKRRCRLTANPQLYRCGKCGGTLQLYEKNTTSCR